MNGSIGTIMFATLLIIHGVHVMLVGLLGLASGNVSSFAVASGICIVTYRCYKGILRRYA